MSPGRLDNCYYIEAKATVYILVKSTQGCYLRILFEVFIKGFYESINEGVFGGFIGVVRVVSKMVSMMVSARSCTVSLFF
jgi:hypothetical protein